MATKWTHERSTKLLMLLLVHIDKSATFKDVNGKTLDKAKMAKGPLPKVLADIWEHQYLPLANDPYQPNERAIQTHIRNLKEALGTASSAPSATMQRAPSTPQKRKMPNGPSTGSTRKRARMEVATKSPDSDSDEPADATPITLRTPSSRRSKTKVNYRITANLSSSDESDNDGGNDDQPATQKPGRGKAAAGPREPRGSVGGEAKHVKSAHTIELDAEDEIYSLAEQTQTGMGMDDDSDASEYRPS